MKSHITKLLSYAKTIGKHLWDQNKHKILKKGFKFIKSRVNDSNKKYVDVVEDTVEDLMKKNIGI